MIINHARGHVEIHSRVEIFQNPTRPTIELTIIRGGLALEPTIELDYEQAQALAETLQRLLVRVDEHANTLEVTQTHPRADTLVQVAEPWVKPLTINTGKEK